MSVKNLLITVLFSFCIAVPNILGQHLHSHSAVENDTAMAPSKNIGKADSLEQSLVTDGVEEHHHNHSFAYAPQTHHVMLMAGIGTRDGTQDFTSLGLGYEYRLPIWDHLVGVGLMGMAMFSPNNSHFMVVGAATLHPNEEWFLQVETGGAHAHNTSTTGPASNHQMALLAGLGVGRHFHVGGIAVAPMLNGEYSRIQKPTYSVILCLGL